MRVHIVTSDARSREKPCLRCGLSLRKNLDDRHCPQCGLSVWLSLNANDSLDGSNPAWLKRLSSAFWLLAALQWLPLVALVLLLLPRSPSSPQRYALAGLVTALYLMVHSAFLLLATWPERRYPDRLAAYKTAIRIIAALSIAFGLALAVRAATRMKSGWPIPVSMFERMRQALPTQPADPIPEDVEDIDPADLLPQRDWWRDGAVIALAAGALATFAYLRRLARRSGNATIARLCGWILLAPLLPLLKTFPILAIFLAAGFYSYIVVAAPFVYYPLSLFLFAWFALTTRRAASAATEHWARESIAPSKPASPG